MCVSLPDRVEIRAIIISYPVSESLIWGKLWLFEVRQRNEKNSYEEFRYFFFGEFFREFIFREQRSIVRITSAVVRGELSKVIRGHSDVTQRSLESIITTGSTTTTCALRIFVLHFLNSFKNFFRLK